jgi:hypothetical protein
MFFAMRAKLSSDEGYLPSGSFRRDSRIGALFLTRVCGFAAAHCGKPLAFRHSALIYQEAAPPR